VFSLAPTYTVRFNETGLPTGTPWSVSVELPNYTRLTFSTSSANLSFQEPNGTYTFEMVGVPNYAATPPSGYFYVEGQPVNESITFARDYAVTFIENGLPSGTLWSMEFDYLLNSSSSPTIGFLVLNGTFPFGAYPAGSFSPTPTSGSLTVNGAAVMQEINYSSPTEPVYPVTFTESGLPANTNWSVDLYYYLEWTTGTTLNFTEANGSYPFSVGGGIGYAAAPASGTVNVSGGPASQSIVFSVPTGTYPATFTESNLPIGATWYVNITGESGLVATVGSTTGHSVSMSLPNDTYTFAAATSDHGWTTAAGGKFTISGGPVSESIPFTGPTPPTSSYVVTFVEENLPSGVTWYVNITGQPGLSATVASSSGTELTVSLSNASYSFSVASDSKAWTATGGNFVVNGAPEQMTVAFSTTAGSPTSSSSSSPSVPWTWIGVAIAALAAALLLLFAFYRRRKKKEQKVEGASAPAGAPTTPASSTGPPSSPEKSP
jgi:hypothetical protein